MAFENLDLRARIWKPLGLTWVYAPGQAQASKTAARQPAAKIVPERRQAVPANFGAPASAGPEPAKNIAPASVAQRFTPLPVSQWPEIWQDQLADTRRAPLAWTYWNLGTDLLAIRGVLAQGEAEKKKTRNRLDFLRALLGDIGFPAATHTFWPVLLNYDGDAAPQPDLFWSGLKALGCRGAIIMGSPAAQALVQETDLRPLTQLREKGMLIWILWDIETFARREDNYGKMVTYLKRVLLPFAPR